MHRSAVVLQVSSRSKGKNSVKTERALVVLLLTGTLGIAGDKCADMGCKAFPAKFVQVSKDCDGNGSTECVTYLYTTTGGATCEILRLVCPGKKYHGGCVYYNNQWTIQTQSGRCVGTYPYATCQQDDPVVKHGDNCKDANPDSKHTC